MSISRRAFSKLALMSGTSLVGSEILADVKLKQNLKPLSILQGLTDSDSTILNIMAHKDQSLNYKFFDETGLEFVPAISSIQYGRDYSEYFIEKLYINNLKVGKEYKVEIYNKSTKIDERLFSTINPFKLKSKIGILSCMKASKHRITNWKGLESQNCDYVLFIGDTVYANEGSTPASHKSLWHKYVDSRKTLYYYQYKKLVPTIAVWDDHDFGVNNGDRSYVHKEEARIVFESFYAQDIENQIYKKGPGVSSYLSIFGQNFAFLDGRTFKSVKSDRLQSIFGANQEDFLFGRLEKSREHTWLVNGLQWFGGYHGQESYENFSTDSMAYTFSKAKKQNFSIGLISGDIHFSEAMEIEHEVLGYPTIELTSSSMHSSSFPIWDDINVNPRRVKSTGSKNYMILSSEIDGFDKLFKAEFFKKKKLLFDYEFEFS